MSNIEIKQRCKILYHRYRLVIKIIKSYYYKDSISFRADMLLLINCISSYNFMIYGDFEYLVALNDYYEIQCIDIMYERLSLEFKKRGL
jgi:hypothetical protein